jgi:transcriptional regulator with XRE-family HTH domain
VRDLRVAHDLSQAQLGADLGVSRQTINSTENGRRRGRLDRAQRESGGVWGMCVVGGTAYAIKPGRAASGTDAGRGGARDPDQPVTVSVPTMPAAA